MTLEEARAFVESNRNKGVACPCCDRFLKVYARTINEGMTKVLARMYRYDLATGGQFFHVHHTIVSEGVYDGDFPKLRFWGLIERQGRREGRYRITELGKQFVEGRLRVPRTVFVLNDEKCGEGSDTVSFEESVRNQFNFKELLAPAEVLS